MERDMGSILITLDHTQATSTLVDSIQVDNTQATNTLVDSTQATNTLVDIIRATNTLVDIIRATNTLVDSTLGALEWKALLAHTLDVHCVILPSTASVHTSKATTLVAVKITHTYRTHAERQTASSSTQTRAKSTTSSPTAAVWTCRRVPLCFRQSLRQSCNRQT
ncbi:unnamed protein product [Leptidea sinapis]|uniref:Uncharacterized protein n=1 Tax=Leptidea sinapis TaxID=189913 RepID=A0A5E4QYH0_9NEOP|nr:unnamed protein product [Leptidea sinapis]